MVGIKIGWSLSDLNPRPTYSPNNDFVALDKVPTMERTVENIILWLKYFKVKKWGGVKGMPLTPFQH